jgi:gliding motility-associated-like protein
MKKRTLIFLTLLLPISIFSQIGGVINNYTPVRTLNPCDNKLTVEDGSAFNAGDTVIMIQMKGAIIDSSNTSNFGTITDYKSSGNYEFNYVKRRSGNVVELKNRLTRTYELPNGKVQLVRVPYYQNATITNTLTCLPWDGSKGGVLVLNVQDSITLNANIDVSGKGFRGGIYNENPVYYCDIDSFLIRNTSGSYGAYKGESIFLNNSLPGGRGKIANGGGGGNATNGGGGGGSNSGAGGTGGNQYVGTLCNTNFQNGGIGGASLLYNNSSNRIFLGGGGGAGQGNEENLGNGGNGGGIAIIIANKIKSNNYSINSKGDAPLVVPISPNDDGRSGGGAGGTILLNYERLLDNLNLSVQGGKGDDCTASPIVNLHGPGGGGGGGTIWINQAAYAPNITTNISGGLSGRNINIGNNPWGATNGSNGNALTDLILPIDNILFKPNIDSVRINKSMTTCVDFDFKGLAYTNSSPIQTWQWYLGDGNTANTQNLSHSYLPGNYTVKLVVTDINGCKDSISTNVIASILTVDAGRDSTICSSQSVQLLGTSNGGIQFLWTPAAYLNNSSILNPVATPPAGNTKFFLVAINASGCTLTDSVDIFVRSANTFSINPPDAVCLKDSIQLFAGGGDIYQWTPGGMSIPNPLVSPNTTTMYSVQITDTLCNNSSNLSTIITVFPLPNVLANKLNDIDCFNSSARLTASGAMQYSWTPLSGLNNPTIPNPFATVTLPTQYIVKGTDINGCINYDSVTVNITADNKGTYLMPTGFTPNNDGLNDCYGVKFWGIITELDFRIYNRWGEIIFHTNKPGECWNGSYKGLPQDPAVFVYFIKAKTTCENYIFRKGTFVLIR